MTAADVIVVGAGPAGCATAVSFADRGASVVLLDADQRPSRRLAGEWLHPSGVRLLHHLGVTMPESGQVRNRGFLIFPGDSTEPIPLAYPGDGYAVSFEHHALVAALRDAAGSHPRIRLVTGTRVTAITGPQATCAAGQRHSGDWLVGADGRSSVVRKSLGPLARCTPLSRTAGVLLEDCVLPHEQHGHVFLGGPGPALAYRLNRRLVRLCLDVPASLERRYPDVGSLYHAYRPFLPPLIAEALRRSLALGRLQWAANRFRSRTQYGAGRVALVGDAVGSYHPMTAVGLTLALMDSECVARRCTAAGDVDPYRRERTAASRVPELLADALYRVFSGHDPATVALRFGVCDLWRRAPAERDRTMRLLTVDETGLGQFTTAFLHVAMQSARRLAGQAVTSRRWREPARALYGMGSWLGWLGSAAFSGRTER